MGAGKHVESGFLAKEEKFTIKTAQRDMGKGNKKRRKRKAEREWHTSDALYAERHM